MFASDGVSPRVVVSASAPAGAFWSASTTGLQFKNSMLAPDGLKQVFVKAGDAGRAKIKVKGLGS